MSLRKKTVSIIKSNPYFYYLLVERRRKDSEKRFKACDDYTSIVTDYERLTGFKLDLSDPKRINEKLQWLKLFYRDDLIPVVSDKYEVRQYLTDIGHPELLNELYAVYTDVDQVDLSKLPDRFVLKVANGSGWNLICKDKSKLNWKIWKKIFNSWMHQNLYYFGREWNYEKQTPRIIAEKYLEDETGELMDFKVMVYNGKASYMQIDADRFTDHHTKLYIRPNGEKLDMHSSYPEIRNFKFDDIHKKIFLLSEELGKPFPHVRMDFYIYNGKIKFGEFTFFDGSGYYSYKPDKYNFILGDELTLPEPNYNLELYKKVMEGKI